MKLFQQMTNTFLLNDFYTIDHQATSDDGKVTATILLNENHAIFKGHFEEMPVVPGVCQTQIIKEILQEHTKQNVMLSKGINIKFTGMIVPHLHPKVSVELTVKQDNSIYTVDAKLYFESTIFTKFKGEFILV